MKFMIVLLTFISWSLCRYFLMANISTVVVDLGERYSLSFNIVCIFNCIFLLVLCLMLTEQVGAEKRRCGRIGSSGWKCLRQNKVRWVEGLVCYTECAYWSRFEVWEWIWLCGRMGEACGSGASWVSPDGSLVVGCSISRCCQTRPRH